MSSVSSLLGRFTVVVPGISDPRPAYERRAVSLAAPPAHRRTGSRPASRGCQTELGARHVTALSLATALRTIQSSLARTTVQPSPPEAHPWVWRACCDVAAGLGSSPNVQPVAERAGGFLSFVGLDKDGTVSTEACANTLRVDCVRQINSSNTAHSAPWSVALWDSRQRRRNVRAVVRSSARGGRLFPRLLGADRGV